MDPHTEMLLAAHGEAKANIAKAERAWAEIEKQHEANFRMYLDGIEALRHSERQIATMLERRLSQPTETEIIS